MSVMSYFVDRGGIRYMANPIGREGERRRWIVFPDPPSKGIAEITDEGGIFTAYVFATAEHPNGILLPPVGSVESAIEAALDGLGLR
jgi:hypothetical protein